MAMVQVSLVAYVTAGAFLGLAYFDYFYNLLLIVAVARVLVARNAAAATAVRDGEIGAQEGLIAGPMTQPAVTRTMAKAGSSVP